MKDFRDLKKNEEIILKKLYRFKEGGYTYGYKKGTKCKFISDCSVNKDGTMAYINFGDRIKVVNVNYFNC